MGFAFRDAVTLSLRRSFFTAWMLVSLSAGCDTPPEYDYSGPRPEEAEPEIPRIPRKAPAPKEQTPTTRREGAVPRPMENKISPKETRLWREHRLALTEVIGELQEYLVDQTWVSTLRVNGKTVTLSPKSALAWMAYVHRSFLIQPGKKVLTPSPNAKPNKGDAPLRITYVLHVEEPLYYLSVALDLDGQIIEQTPTGEEEAKPIGGAVALNVEGKNAEVLAEFLRTLPEFADHSVDPARRIATIFTQHAPKPNQPVRSRDADRDPGENQPMP